MHADADAARAKANVTNQVAFSNIQFHLLWCTDGRTDGRTDVRSYIRYRYL